MVLNDHHLQGYIIYILDQTSKLHVAFHTQTTLNSFQRHQQLLSLSLSTMASPPPPPPPPPSTLYIGGGTFNEEPVPHPPPSIQTLSPSILIIILILTVTVIVSISLCLLLRHLNGRCIRHLSTATTSSTATSIAAADSHRHSSSRVSPETPTFSVIDSLPLFTFSSITRLPSSATNGCDCAVCLSKFEPQDQLRLLPLCCHAFHVQCIDTWLQSNQTCPLCRSAIHASESDVIKALLASSNNGGGGGGGGNDSFRLEIGSISRRRAASSDFGEPPRSSYSIGSFDYIVEEESEISVSRRSASDKEESGAEPAIDPSLADDVASGRSWLKDYVDRLSSISSRALSFRSSGRFFTGSSRRSDIAGAGDWDLEANQVGEEISELFRWFSGV